MSSTPDYNRYTIEQLADMKKNINKEKHPERAREIELALSNKMEEPAVKEMLEKHKEKFEKQKKMKKYLTFWPRFWAVWIDGIIFAIILYAECFVFGVEFNIKDEFLKALNAIQFSIYVIFMHGYFGQTLGKMVVKVKVLNHDTETDINIKQALRRESVNLVLNICWVLIILAVVASLEMSGIILNGLSYAVIVFSILSFVWGVSEFVTMLFNDKRRAVHDYIGKTVVVRT